MPPAGNLDLVRIDEGSSFEPSDEVKRAENEAMFRETNERIRDLVDRPDFVLPVVPFLCECADPTCRRLLNVPLPVYLDVRSSSRRFIHAVDHVDDGTTGSVVATLDGYAVVEKSGAAARVAERAEGKGGLTVSEQLNERDRRRALNEAAFREVNERIRGLNATFSEFSGEFSIVCECDDAACVEHLAVRPDEYEAIRSDPTLFAVLAGHESLAVETIEEERGAYNVVRKRPGEPARIAAATDPRGD